MIYLFGLGDETFCYLTGFAASVVCPSFDIFPVRSSGLKITILYLTFFSCVLLSHTLLVKQREKTVRKVTKIIHAYYAWHGFLSANTNNELTNCPLLVIAEVR